MKAPLSDQKPAATDGDVLWYGFDRTNRQKTEAIKSPHDESIDLGKGLDAFRKLHGEMLEYARTNRGGSAQPSRPERRRRRLSVDLEISAHTQRHILQIREIKSQSELSEKVTSIARTRGMGEDY